MTGRRNSGGRVLRSKRYRNDSELTAREARLRARLIKAEQASSGPPPNESEQIAAPHDGLMCAYCKKAIANTDDYVIITPCEHQLCTLCTLRSHTSRGREEHCCPVASCDNNISSGCRFMSHREERETLIHTTPSKDYARVLRDKDATSRKSDRFGIGIKVNKHLRMLVEKITDMQLWKADEPPVLRGEKANTEISCDPDIVNLPGGVNLPAFTLSSIMGTGDERLIYYFITYYIDNYNNIERSEKGLAKVKTTMKDLKAAVELDTKLASTTSAQDLKLRECTKALILKEIDLMAERDKSREGKKLRIPAHNMDQNTKKPTIIDFLITRRQKEFKAYPTLAQELKDGILQRRSESNVVTSTSRGELMKSEFFSLGKHLSANADAYS